MDKGPVTTIDLPMLRNSERGAFKKCPQAWQWGWQMGLRRQGFSPNALWFGTGIHLAFAEWYLPGLKRGKDPRETWDAWSADEIRAVKVTKVDQFTDEEHQEWTDARELGLHVLDHYLETFGKDESWNVISPEQTFSVNIPSPLAKGVPIITLKGTFDGVYRDEVDGKIKLMEHKTAASISTGHLSLDDQAGTYWAIATHVLRRQGLIGEKDRLHGITYNFLRKAYRDDRPQNAEGLYTNKPLKEHFVNAIVASDNVDLDELGLDPAKLAKFTLAQLQAAADKYSLTVLGEVSKTQPAPHFQREWVTRTAKERKVMIDRIGKEALQMNHFRANPDLIYKSPRYDCFRYCEFFELCEVHEAGGDWEEFASYAYGKVDMYADHRKSAAE